MKAEDNAKQKSPFVPVFLDFCQLIRIFCVFVEKSPDKVWCLRGMLLPLHPLSGSSAPFATRNRSLKEFHEDREVVQEARCPAASARGTGVDTKPFNSYHYYV